MRGCRQVDFFKALVAQVFATASHTARRGTLLYHLHGKPLYRAIGERDHRHRRPVSLGRGAEGLIWARLCAAVLQRFLAHAAQRVGNGTAMSTRRVAMCAHHILDELVAALLIGFGLLATLRRGLTYLLANARRASPDRDRRIGRLRAGLAIVQVP